ncbi:MAG TPA: hypothetical protein VFN74_04365 [Chloroflexota bacterium]|jgi:hypothetical protein|nr:hypothetical protein [Chloroflexota bacterium]
MEIATDTTIATPEVGLLAADEVKSVLRDALGGAATEAQLDDAVARLQAAEVAKWEQLPPEIDPDMGYNFRFLSCSETCWLGRQVLLEGATFRVFKLREQPAS